MQERNLTKTSKQTNGQDRDKTLSKKEWVKLEGLVKDQIRRKQFTEYKTIRSAKKHNP
ncbi:MAG: hypothetical protein KAS70_04460 [Planctomycetes bacterium]|nr:hypothetical protein [Planctomycetota bacterium]